MPWGIPVLQIAHDARTVYTHLQLSRAGDNGHQIRYKAMPGGTMQLQRQLTAALQTTTPFTKGENREETDEHASQDY